MYITFPYDKSDLQKLRIKMVLINFLCYTGHDLQIFGPEGKAVHSEFHIQVPEM